MAQHNRRFWESKIIEAPIKKWEKESKFGVRGVHDVIIHLEEIKYLEKRDQERKAKKDASNVRFQ